MSPEVAAPAAFDAESLTEYIEIFMLANATPRLSKSELRNSLPPGHRPTDAEISFALFEIERRSGIARSAYPYSVLKIAKPVSEQQGAVAGVGDDSERVVVRAESLMSPVYDFMLLCSMENSPMRAKPDYKIADLLFDAIVREASAQYFGPEGRSLIFSWPARGGRPKNFKDAVSWVGQQLGIPDTDRVRPLDEKDSGVDVIAWRPFADGRGAFIVVLFQNTLRVNFTGKVREVVTNMWRSWLHFGTAPKVGFATPLAVRSSDDRWNTVSYSADIILDRLRIAETMRHRPSFPELAEIRAFNAGQLAEIKDGQGGGKIISTLRRGRNVAATRRRGPRSPSARDR